MHHKHIFTFKPADDRNVLRTLEDLTLAADHGDEQERLTAARAHSLARNQVRAALARELIARHCSNPVVNIALNAIPRRICNAPLSNDQAAVLKAIGEDTGAGAGYIREIFEAVWDMLGLFGAFNTLGVTEFQGRTNKLAINSALPTASWVLTEADPMSEDGSFAGTSISPKSEVFGCLVSISMQLLQDLELDLAPSVLEKTTRALAKCFDYACFMGSGVADTTNGGQTGLFIDSTITAVTAAAGNTTVGAMGEDDFLAAVQALPDPVIQRGPQFWMNPGLIIRAMSIKSNGRRIVKTQLESDTGGAQFSVVGFPLNPVAVAASTNVAGSKIAMAGLPDAYCAGIRKEFTVEQSLHVAWNKLQSVFRVWGRGRGVIKDATGFVGLKTAAL